MSERPLRDQVALVTGASRGIGRAIAGRLARLGAHVVCNYAERRDAAEQTLRIISEGGGSAELAQADVGTSAAARGLVERVIERRGRLDVLVNNAAVQRLAAVHRTSDEDWQRTLDVNLSAAFWLSRAALPVMVAARRGHVVNVTSASAYVPQRGAAAYVASKLGLIGLTRVMALEVASKGVLVNAVAPGLTDTDMIAALTDAQRAAMAEMVPLGRMAAPEEVASMVGWIVSDVRYSTGNVFHVSGGVTAG